MGLIRLLIILFLIWLAVYFVRRLLNSKAQAKPQAKPRKLENMVACAKCGLHVPEQEALRAHDRYYCSKAHRDEAET